MRVFIIHLSPKTCQNFSLKETHITPLLESLKLQGISYEIFDAIYSKISPTQLHPLILEHLHPSFMVEDLWAFCKNKKHPPCALKNFFYAIKHCGKRMGFGELGCYASHYSLWQKCIELNEAICILEDDITLKEDFKEGLDFLEKHIQELGYIRLMHLLYDASVKSEPLSHKNHEIQERVGIIKAYSEGVGTQGYVITPKIAKVFLKCSRKWVVPVDTIMDATFIHGVKNLVLQPFVIADDEQISTIARKEEPYSPKIALMRELHFKYLKYWQFV